MASQLSSLFGALLGKTCCRRMKMFGVLLCLVLALSSVAEAADLLDRCPTNLPRSDYLKATEWDMCYEFHKEERTWRSASGVCSSRGGRLVTINEKRIQDFLIDQLYRLRWPRNGLWLGANDRANEMDWRWITGERVKSGYSNWASGQPSCGFFCFEDCAVMRWREGGRWHDYRCNWVEDYSFICEFEMLPEPTTTTTTTKTTTPTTTTTSTTTTTTPTTTTTTTTPTTTTTTTTSTTPKPLTTKSLESRYMVHVHGDGTTEPENVTEILPPPAPPVFIQAANGARAGHMQERVKESSSSLGTGSIAGLIVGILIGLSAGVCCLGFLLFRRRRRRQRKEDEPGISYENPYYGEAKTPLKSKDGDSQVDNDSGDFDVEDGGAATGGSDELNFDKCKLALTAEGEKASADKGARWNQPLPPSPLHSRPQRTMNEYDTPPTLTTHVPAGKATKVPRDGKDQSHCTKETYAQSAYRSSSADEEPNYYDEIRPQCPPPQFTYDVPRSNAPSAQRYQLQEQDSDNESTVSSNIYANNPEECLYESVDNLRAMVANQALRREAEADHCDNEEENRYVPFVLDNASAK